MAVTYLFTLVSLHFCDESPRFLVITNRSVNSDNLNSLLKRTTNTASVIQLVPASLRLYFYQQCLKLSSIYRAGSAKAVLDKMGQIKGVETPPGELMLSGKAFLLTVLSKQTD